jgi:hypothetical protein
VKVLENNSEYKKIIELLSDTKSFRSGPIIEVNKHYTTGRSRSYRLHDRFFRKGITTYTLTKDKTLGLRKKSFYEAWSKAIDNVIPRNLINVYGSIELPTKEQILNRAKEIIAAKKPVGKGKLLKFLGKDRKRIDTKKFSIVEDAIQIFEHLTKDGYIVPGDSEAAGGRWADSFSLMPSWIRKMCKKDGELIFENDYSCLHPNIAMGIYGGSQSFITHQGVADVSGLEKSTVKIEHLSFFNKQYHQMERSPLFNHYISTEKEMIANIYGRKCQPYELNGSEKEGYKNVSLDLFRKETSVMTYAIQKLNSEGIYVLYVYDALYSSHKDSARVAQIMNESAWELGVMTSVDGSNPFKEEVEEVTTPIVEEVVVEPIVEVKPIIEIKPTVVYEEENIEMMFSDRNFKKQVKEPIEDYVRRKFFIIKSSFEAGDIEELRWLLKDSGATKQEFGDEYKKQKMVQ